MGIAGNDVLIGRKIGKITVLEKTEEKRNEFRMYLCKCDCGTVNTYRSSWLHSAIKHGKNISCGCQRTSSLTKANRSRSQDLRGKLFGDYEVIESTDARISKSIVWKLVCIHCRQVVYFSTSRLNEKKEIVCACRTNMSGEDVLSCEGKKSEYITTKTHTPTLQEKYPEIAKEWHPTKNFPLTPADVSASSNQKVWWQVPYDDPQTRKHFDFEWQSAIANRVRGCGCPFLYGKKVYQGFNDLQTVYPQISSEWDQEKNNGLQPFEVSKSSTIKVWWKCKKGHSWEARVADRIKTGNCPVCSKERSTSFPEYAILYYLRKIDKSVIHSYKDLGFELDIFIPSKNSAIEYDGAHWHKEAVERDLEKNRLCQIHGITLYRIRENALNALNSSSIDIMINKGSFERELRKLIASIYHQTLDICISRDEALINRLRDFTEKENSLAEVNPSLAMEWHPKKNGKLTPNDVKPHSMKKVWWLFAYDDPKTGKHFDFEWLQAISQRTKNPGCPFLSGKAVWTGFNDLLTTAPVLAVEWHPTKNGGLIPQNVSRGQRDKVWWFLPYDDPKTGRHYDFEWEAQIRNRAHGQGCPFLSGQALYKGFNDLATTNPNLAAEWHPTKNGELGPDDVMSGSARKVWWFLPYDDPKTGKHFEFEWESSVSNRSQGARCPYLFSKAVWPGFNDLATVNPELAMQWHPTKNNELTPDQVMASSDKKVWWLVSFDNPETGEHYEREWEERISNRTYSKKRG